LPVRAARRGCATCPSLSPSASAKTLEAAARAFADAEGLKLGQVAQPLRAALTGKASSPPLFAMMEVLGRDESLIRLKAYAS